MDRTIKPRTTAATEECIWSSSLLSGPLMEIGGRFLATGDIDYYVNMRTVVSSWRAAMDNPKERLTDPLFLLREWVMLDEEERGKTNTFDRLFLNIDTGRFHHINLPALPKYYFVISTGGLLVLATRKPPHTVLVVNPFTDSYIKFRAPMPDSLLQTTAHVRLAGTTPTLLLEHPSGDMAYSATPEDEHFAVVNYNLLNKGHNIWGIRDHILDDLLSNLIATRAWEKYPCYYFLQSAGEMLLVLGRKHPDRGMEVFKVNFQQKMIEPMRNIGSRALFLGDRCVSVDAHKFPSINDNCVFYRGRDQDDRHDCIYKYDVTTEKEELLASDVIEFSGFNGKPVAPSLIHLLVNYCTNIPWSQLETERRYGHIQEVHMEE